MSEKRKNSKSGQQDRNRPAGPMDVDLLARIVALMQAHDLNTVDVRDGDRRVILKRGMAGVLPAAMTPAAPATAHALPAAPSPPTNEELDAGSLRISSPMVGTFYAAAKPGEKPFVTVGSVVTEETDVCIIEAMKTFNNIKAECRGTIAKVLASDGQPVEFGTVLFLVKPS